MTSFPVANSWPHIQLSCKGADLETTTIGVKGLIKTSVGTVTVAWLQANPG